jgi:hypothetical protein
LEKAIRIFEPNFTENSSYFPTIPVDLQSKRVHLLFNLRRFGLAKSIIEGIARDHPDEVDNTLYSRIIYILEWPTVTLDQIKDIAKKDLAKDSTRTLAQIWLKSIDFYEAKSEQAKQQFQQGKVVDAMITCEEVLKSGVDGVKRAFILRQLGEAQLTVYFYFFLII